jgi:hypothetical protein
MAATIEATPAQLTGRSASTRKLAHLACACGWNHNLIDAPRQPGHDPDPNSNLRQQQGSEQQCLPVNLIDATHQPD